jgi:hypothetical protein
LNFKRFKGKKCLLVCATSSTLYPIKKLACSPLPFNYLYKMIGGSRASDFFSFWRRVKMKNFYAQLYTKLFEIQLLRV